MFISDVEASDASVPICPVSLKLIQSLQWKIQAIFA